jgi:hypothetical protein
LAAAEREREKQIDADGIVEQREGKLLDRTATAGVAGDRRNKPATAAATAESRERERAFECGLTARFDRLGWFDRLGGVRD